VRWHRLPRAGEEMMAVDIITSESIMFIAEAAER
jgi:hypothetical protein